MDLPVSHTLLEGGQSGSTNREIPPQGDINLLVEFRSDVGVPTTRSKTEDSARQSVLP